MNRVHFYNYIFFKATDVKIDAGIRKSKSKEVNTKADELAKDVEETLKFSLKGVKKRAGELRKMREIIQGRIGQVNDGLLKFDKEKEVGKCMSALNLVCSKTHDTDDTLLK